MVAIHPTSKEVGFLATRIVKSKGIIPSNFIEIVHVLECVSEYKDEIAKHIDKFLDYAEDKIKDRDDVPEGVRNILHIRRRNSEILSMIGKLKDMESDDKEQLAKDLKGLINGGR